MYIYFPVDGQISKEFGEKNDLFRRKDENGNPAGGFIDPEKRNIKAIRLRGNKSDGLILPLSALAPFGEVSGLAEGDIVTVFNGHEIACKYIPRCNHPRSSGAGNRTRKHKINVAPLFTEHADTEQLAYNLNAFQPGDQIEITLKIHGTSQRTAHVPVLKEYKRTFLDHILRREGTPIYDWGYVSGTRRTVLNDWEGGFYGSNAFREQHAKKFEGKLWKGESVYYEVAGFTDTGVSIMGECSNKKLNDKEFSKMYGDTTVFSYGCSREGKTVVTHEDENGDRSLLPMAAPQSDIWVYRMTMTNEDGEVVEYTSDFMRYRCEQMGVKCVPVFWKGYIPAEGHDYPSAGEWIKSKAEAYYDGPDPIGKTHVREGVVVRIINRPKFTAYKHKNFAFKVLEGIIKDVAQAPDMEEAEEITE